MIVGTLKDHVIRGMCLRHSISKPKAKQIYEQVQSHLETLRVPADPNAVAAEVVKRSRLGLLGTMLS